MKQLMDMIIALPLTKFRSFLLTQKNLEPNSLLHSLLYFKTVNEGFAVDEVMKFPDPLALELERFNDTLAKHPDAQHSALSEDVRMPISIRLFQEYILQRPPNFKELSKKIQALIDIYYDIFGGGYSAYTLTSLLATVTHVANQRTYRERLYTNLTRKKHTEPPFEHEKILDVYASLDDVREVPLINLLRQFEAECINCKKTLEIFIEEYCFSFAIALKNGGTVDDFFDAHNDWKQAIYACESITILQIAIYEKGISAAERVTLFNKIFFEENKKIIATGNADLDKAVKKFKQNIMLLFSSKNMPKHALFTQKQGQEKLNASASASLNSSTPSI